ncbi:Zinc finger C2H2-type [Sesbania bispinosa]|nr:Zinc finger C2H2-type [Sesbania bispinosa]
MDSQDQKIKLNDELHQEASDSEKPLKKIEKMNSSPSEFCKPSDKLKGDEEDISTSKKAAASGVHPCEFCDKNFPSEKSLHDHLRSHPERFWKGVHPPEPSSQSQNSNYSMEENNDRDDNGGQILSATMEATIDISKYLPLSWNKTDKRGRACTYRNEDIIAAQILMFKSRDNKKTSHSMVNPKLSQHANLNKTGDECDKNNGEKSIKAEVIRSELHDQTVVMMNKKNNKKIKLLVKQKNPNEESEEKILPAPEDDNEEESQSGLQIHDFDLNERTNVMEKETN